MANKKTIHQLESEIDIYMRRLNHCVRNITERRDLIKKIRMGKVKQPPPSVKAVSITSTLKPADNDLSDPVPTFGGTPNTSFD